MKRKVFMLIVDVTGSNKTKRDIAYNVVHYMIKQLMPRLRNIEIEVKLITMTGDAVGYCLMADSNRDFELEIDKNLNIKDLVMTLCHEMVHVKQYVRREMDDWNGLAVARWKNKTVMPGTNYYELPWEKEAYELQASLAKDCWKNDIF